MTEKSRRPPTFDAAVVTMRIVFGDKPFKYRDLGDLDVVPQEMGQYEFAHELVKTGRVRFDKPNGTPLVQREMWLTPLGLGTVKEVKESDRQGTGEIQFTRRSTKPRYGTDERDRLIAVRPKGATAQSAPADADDGMVTITLDDPFRLNGEQRLWKRLGPVLDATLREIRIEARAIAQLKREKREKNSAQPAPTAPNQEDPMGGRPLRLGTPEAECMKLLAFVHQHFGEEMFNANRVLRACIKTENAEFKGLGQIRRVLATAAEMGLIMVSGTKNLTRMTFTEKYQQTVGAAAGDGEQKTTVAQMPQHNAIEALKAEVARLTTELAATQARVAKLETQLAPFKMIAKLFIALAQDP